MPVTSFPPVAIDLLVSAGSIVPIEPAGVVLEQHALAIDKGRILAVLPTREARARYQPRESLDLPGHALMPAW